MKFHPLQHDIKALEKISEAFEKSMGDKGLLPKNPWRAKRVHEWLAKMGAKMSPGVGLLPIASRRFDPNMGCVDCSRYVNFIVDCPPSKNRVRGTRGRHFMRLEIPWELADKVLVLGYLP